jgi:hypothetical protein
MNKLLILTSVALVGGSAFALAVPRVYDYRASLKCTVAKNAATVTWTDENGDKQTEANICYRVKGTVSVKGVIVLGCDCNDLNDVNEPVTLADGYPLVLMATSADKYCQVVFAWDDSDTGFWGATRFGSALSCKATSAGLGFDVGFTVGPTNGCQRDIWLSNAGFGTASKIESVEGFDITSISGSTVGWADAPYCSAAQNNCPRCLNDGECEYALAFTPCSGVDCTGGPWDGSKTSLDWDVVYGTFTLKFNKTYSNLIKPIDQADVQATINALVPKAFNSCSASPVYVPPAG